MELKLNAENKSFTDEKGVKIAYIELTTKIDDSIIHLHVKKEDKKLFEYLYALKLKSKK